MSYIDDPRFYYDRYFNNPDKVDAYSLLPFRPTNPDKYAEKYYQNKYQYGGNTEEYPLENLYSPRPPKEPMYWDPTFSLSKTQDPSLDPYLFNPYARGKLREQFKADNMIDPPQSTVSQSVSDDNYLRGWLKKDLAHEQSLYNDPDSQLYGGSSLDPNESELDAFTNKDTLSSCLKHFLVIGCGAFLFLFLFMVIIITSYISVGFYKSLKAAVSDGNGLGSPKYIFIGSNDGKPTVVKKETK